MTLPSAYLTQQDFVSTFPWGLRGDRVRIIQQEVENDLLDAETLAAMAVMLGGESSAPRLDEAWKLLLNSQNHDVHVCMHDEVGIEWCQQARAIVQSVREQAGAFLARRAGTTGILANTLSWSRPAGPGKALVPAFGYACTGASGAQPGGGDDRIGWPLWNGSHDAGGYSARMLDNGTMEVRLGGAADKAAVLGNLTLWTAGRTLDSAQGPVSLVARLSLDGRTALARVAGALGDIGFAQEMAATPDGVDIMTELDYGDGRSFGPEQEDLELQPRRRAYYFQHERKLCMNCAAPSMRPRLLYNSPFLTWPAAASGSVESLHFATLEADQWGLSHFNIGQGGYWYDQDSGLLRHALAFAPRVYVYGQGDKPRMSGKYQHRCRILAYAGDWRTARLPLRSAEFNRPIIAVSSSDGGVSPAAAGSLLAIDSNSTIATAMFERGGRLFVRLWEWSGQEDHVALHFGNGTSLLMECSHRLRPQRPLDTVFTMRPWEIKTVELRGAAKPMEIPDRCSRGERFAPIPAGWARKSLFDAPAPAAGDAPPNSADAPIYFMSGYHDGFVKPLEKPTDTMLIEMERVRSSRYRNYTSTWEIGASCWDRIAQNDPAYLETLKPYLKEGSIELVGGTWSEPLSLIISGESNLRQFMYGLDTIQELLGTPIYVYMNQEHATFAQMPQILGSMGLTTVVNRTHWAPFGYESGLDADVARWTGVDGSMILLVPRYNSMDYLIGNHIPSEAPKPKYQHDGLTGHNTWWRSEENFKWIRDQACRRGVNKPLMTMLEDIWSVRLRSTDEEMERHNSYSFVRFTTIARYLPLFGLKVEPQAMAKSPGLS